MDIDLEKFFDNVPQDRLMSLVNNVIHDGDTEWKVPSRREWGLRKMGIEKWQAHALSYSRNPYVSAHLPQVKKAISKETLTRRKHLVSPLDYYVQKHALKLS